MEIKRYLRFLKVSLLLTFSAQSHAQMWEKTNTIRLKDAPVASATDFQGNLYLGFADGRLSKYDADGIFLENFSLANNSAISLIDVQNNLKPFIFYFDIQQITILDRFSSIPRKYNISDFGSEIGMMTCPAPDADFWIIENNPQRLKKVNPLRKSTILEVQVSIGDSISRMQAYQNILAIGSQNKIHIFDQFGGLLHTLKFDTLFNFQIIRGTLFAFTSKEILEINPFKGTIVSTINKPDNAGIMLKSRNGFLSLRDNSVSYFKSN
ncbi:hypothetical protein [Ekhidna sp. To15]|uniref:hypothetical protein n=1 Tax=Ekhidna sp. To15 TaxID=3395267 RepID=UPI003F51F6E4